MCSEKNTSNDKENVENLVEILLKSYQEHELICRIDKDNIVNKETLIRVVEEIRCLLFPGYFDNSKIRSEYARSINTMYLSNCLYALSYLFLYMASSLGVRFFMSSDF